MFRMFEDYDRTNLLRQLNEFEEAGNEILSFDYSVRKVYTYQGSRDEVQLFEALVQYRVNPFKRVKPNPGSFV